MACTNPRNPTCFDCNKSGLAILPARYAVVPMDIDASVPASMGNKVTNVKLSHHKYALRTLRAGFFYVYHEKHPRGSQIKWEVYAVSEAGTLWSIPSIRAIKPIDEEPHCSRKGHNMPASVIRIEAPEKCKRVWIAFSEHIWNPETLAAFEKDATLRDRRMQTLLPATWVATGGYPHGLPATQANIEQIVEYKPGFRPEMLSPTAAPRISLIEKDGRYSSSVLKRQSTLYPAVSRNGQSEATAKLMTEIGENPKSNNHPPMVMGVWDAVGIAHELNGFCNDVVGWSEKYMDELQMQVSAMMTIDGLKEVLGQHAADAQEQFQEDVKNNGMQQPDTTVRHANAARLPQAEQARANEINDFIDELRTKKVSSLVIQPAYLDHINTMSEPQRSAELAKVRKQADELVNARSKNGASNIENARTDAWSKYEKKLDKHLYPDFKKHYTSFQDAVQTLANDRTADLVRWLEGKNLIDAFTEFHGQSISDGVVFDDQVGRAIFGMNHSKVGQDKIVAWVKEMKATDTNLLWRAMALNQITAIPELDAYLQDAKQHNDKQIVASTVDWLAMGQKSLKTLADTYKKATGIYNANTSAASEKGAMAFNVRIKPIKTLGIDRQIMTAGDAIMKQFRLNGILDYAGEKMVQHLLSVRALVNPLDSLQLIQAQAKNDGVIRKQTIERLRTARAFLASDQPAMRTAQTDSMRHAWEEFKNSEKAPNAIKDVRVALLVMLIEGVNFGKMLHACKEKGDAKSWWGLAASGMTITSGLFDVAGGVLKNMTQNVKGEYDKGAALWNFQKLKLFGGVLSSATAAISVGLDATEYSKNKEIGYKFVANLYFAKALIGLASATLSLATALTYSTPLIRELTVRATLSVTAKVVAEREVALIVARILLMSAGAWVSVALFALQVVIWLFSDDELQKWCALCPFGENYGEKGAYRYLSEQMNALNKALVDIGLAETSNTAKKGEDRFWEKEPKPSLDELKMHD